MKRYIVKYKDDWNKTRTFGIYPTEEDAKKRCWELVERDLFIVVMENNKVSQTIYNQSWSAV